MEIDLVNFATFLLYLLRLNFLFIIIFIGIDKSKIDFVELVGEATRIPICIQQIKDVYGKDPSRTLNSTDCIARGCAL